MYCPLCGQKLTEVSRKKKWFKSDESVWFACDNCKSFGDDYPLVMHYPGKDITSPPGDSWSLSWIK